jgi:hypothetical protein
VSGPSPDKRSQQLFRLPRDQTPVTVTLEDGEQAHAMLFLAPGSSVIRFLEEASPFVPVSYTSGLRLVARDSIACVTVQATDAPPDDPELPLERQRVRIRLRGGRSIEGELRWIAPAGRRRTADCLNDPLAHVVVHDGQQVSFVAKAHIAYAEEV